MSNFNCQFDSGRMYTEQKQNWKQPSNSQNEFTTLLTLVATPLMTYWCWECWDVPRVHQNACHQDVYEASQLHFIGMLGWGYIQTETSLTLKPRFVWVWRLGNWVYVRVKRLSSKICWTPPRVQSLVSTHVLQPCALSIFFQSQPGSVV